MKVLTLFLTILACGCSKPNEEIVQPASTDPHLANKLKLFKEQKQLPDKTIDHQQLIVGSWKMTDMQSDLPADWDGNGTLETDRFSSLTPCQKDAIWKFDANGGGTDKIDCNTTWNMTWDLTQKGWWISQKFNTGSFTSNTYEYRIDTLTAQRLVIKVITFSPAGQSVIMRVSHNRL